MSVNELEQTLVLIKPDALKNSLTGYVISHLSEYHTGLRFAGAKIVHVSTTLAEEHYAEHRGKPFFPSLINLITGITHYPNEPWKQRVVAFVYQGPNAIKKIREIAGPTNPHQARELKPGCIRALGTVAPIVDPSGKQIGERMDNLIHASANESDAEREIKLWFKPCDIPPLMHAYPTVRCEDHYYLLDNRLVMTYEKGSTLLLSPGDHAWKSDMDTLSALRRNGKADASLGSVAAKYLVNNPE